VGEISAAWMESLARACTELSLRYDIDKSARVEVSSGPRDGLTLHATLRDGRSAVREVESREGLALTMAALLVLPTPAVAPQPASATGRVAKQRRVDPQRETEAPAPRPVSSLLHLGLGASAIGHVMGTPTYVAAGFAVRVSLRLGALVVDVTPRWEAGQASLRMRLPDFEMHNVGLGAFFGLRLWDGIDGAVEAGAGTLLLAETQSYREAGTELVGTVISGQMAMFARLLWGNPPSLRWTMGLEASLVPRRLSHETRVRDMLPPLPSFGVGIGFGGQWESS
jgi:hypothetical protein